ncbi:MAG: tRNA dihydrouridine synthase DusB [Candidatus Hydrogenedentes bacterium]|nr:tRNA dihydrouridine synthase DusB [Candidatus Hydrogenedentota bacterium]
MRIGPIELQKPLALAPMEDVSDASFRLICKELGADLLYTEFTSSEGLIRDARKSLQKLDFSEAERPIAIQLFGGSETSMEAATRIAERANPDFIDINCGCWVRDVALRGAGAGLLRDLSRFETVVKSVIAATSLPVTVKTRLGWDAESIVILDVARMLEQAGAQALTIHCRTREQGHKGAADWSWLERIKQTVAIPVIGNGDLVRPEDVSRMFETGCDGAMIGRGAIQNPWIFRQTKHYLATREPAVEPSPAERTDLCVKHLRHAVARKGERRGVIEFRKHYAGYLRGLPNAAKLRASLMQFTERAQVESALFEFVEHLTTEAAA